MISETIALIQTNYWFFYSLVFFVSLMVGSFLNVVIHRLPIILNKEWLTECRSFLHPEDPLPEEDKYTLSVPRSACPKCGNQITWYQNIPVISWVMLKGKCSNCKSPISAKYPLIELATALLSFAAAWKFGATAQSIYAILLIWILIPLVFIDFAEQILPDRLIFPLIGLGLLAGANSIFISAEQSIYGALLGFTIIWVICQIFKIITKKEGMGFGDFKMFAAAGAWFGALAMPNILIIAAVSGAIVGIVLMAMRGKSVPYAFGPYIALSMWITLMFGSII